MADPQLEKGYTRIANELLEAVCRTNLSGSELRILLYIIRRTYGFNRSYAEIPLSEIAGAVGMNKVNVSRALKKLRELNLIDLRPYRGTKPQTISIVKNYEEWNVESCASLPLSKMITVINSDNPTVINSDNPTVINSDNPTVINSDNPTVINSDNPTVINSDNLTYKENIKERFKERGKERTRTWGSYGNVSLSQEQMDKLINNYGKECVDKYIDRVDCHVQSTGRTYRDYSAVIRKWIEEDGAGKKQETDYNAIYEEFTNDF